jgi:D-alanine-D-alanine ligase
MDAGLNTSTFSLVARGTVPDIAGTDLRYPVFVKPANRGGGEGVDSNSLVHNLEQLQDKVASISNGLQADSLVENYLPGREFSVAVLKNEYDDEYTVVPLELKAGDDDAVLSAEIKSANTEVVTLVTDEELRDELSILALDVFEALGARDYGRIDIRMDEYGVPHFLEANLLPSLIDDYGSFPKACVLGMDIQHEQMLLAIVSLAFARLFINTEDTVDAGLYMPTPIPLTG